MDKYGVDEAAKPGEKQASDTKTHCPVCGSECTTHGRVVLCPVHGSKPFETNNGKET